LRGDECPSGELPELDSWRMVIGGGAGTRSADGHRRRVVVGGVVVGEVLAAVVLFGLRGLADW